MYRPNCLWGWILIAFGAGVLIGLWIEGGFLAHCFAIAVILCGCGVWKKR